MHRLWNLIYLSDRKQHVTRHAAGNPSQRVRPKESGASTAEGALLEKSGNTRDDGVWKRITFEVRDGALARPGAPAMIWCAEVGPDSVSQVQTATSRIIVKAKGVAASPARRCSKNQRKKGQEVGPRSDISVRLHQQEQQ